MKYLLTGILLLFTFNLNAQSLSMGSDNVQLGASNIDGQESVFAGYIYDKQIIKFINARIGLGASLTRFNDFANPYENNLDLYVNPSLMIGTTIPVDNRISIGIYTGYRSSIGEHVRHSWNPVSVSIQL